MNTTTETHIFPKRIRRVYFKRRYFSDEHRSGDRQIAIAHAAENLLFNRVVTERRGGQTLSVLMDEQRFVEVAYREGRRELVTTKRQAVAAYTIDWLFDGTFYVQIQIEYRTGDCHGKATSDVFSTRDECVNHFLWLARRHFESDYCVMSESQRTARAEMSEMLEPNLFGFVEPTPINS